MPRRQRSRGHRRRPWWRLLSFLRRRRTPPQRRYPNGCLGLPLQYAVLDVETTGLDPVRDRVVEVAVVLLDSHGHALHEWSTLVNPGIGTSGPRHIHGISSEWLADAPPFSAVVGDIGALLTGRTLVGHNSTFDVDFITAELLQAGLSGPRGLVHVDTMEMCARADRPVDLQGACASIGYTYLPHSALEDARATAQLLRWFLPRLEPSTMVIDGRWCSVRPGILPTRPSGRTRARPILFTEARSHATSLAKLRPGQRGPMRNDSGQ